MPSSMLMVSLIATPAAIKWMLVFPPVHMYYRCAVGLVSESVGISEPIMSGQFEVIRTAGQNGAA